VGGRGWFEGSVGGGGGGGDGEKEAGRPTLVDVRGGKKK